MRRVTQFVSLFLLAVMMLGYQSLFAQTTTSSISGRVVDQNGEALPGASIIAVHVPSGSQYGTSSRVDGRYNIIGMRVGGPYKVTVSYVGFENQVQDNIYLNLGVASNVNFTMRDKSIEVGEVSVSAKRDAVFSSDRTGAATAVAREALEFLPTVSRRIGDFTRLTPQSSGNSFAGQDNRMNNITVDGSYFNNSFGLAGQPGERTGVAPISLDAIEQIQVNIAPYDVRQGNFVGAGVNTVTKSGTNQFKGSAYYIWRTQGLVGTKAKDLTVNPGTFNYKQIGLFLGGPIIQNKLFFFTSFEKEDFTQPATTYRANLGGETATGNVTRVLASDLDKLSSYLSSNFGYDTGPYQGYDFKTPATRFIFKLDYNLNDKNKITLRYNHLDSETDVLLSNSSSLGNGSRRTSTTALNFANSNYSILENIRSIIGEWNSVLGDNMSNNLIVGYTYQDESRGYKGAMFPFVDILSGGSTYTSFGFEPFTPNNELRYKTFQVQDNLSVYLAGHNLTFGISAERYESENVFFPGSQSVYVYNSLDDFYKDANDYLANPNRTVSPVTLKMFQVRWNNIPGQVKPVQPLKVFYAGAYAQDEFNLNKDIKLSVGLRVDMPMFEETGYKNEPANNLFFMDEDGNQVQYQTEKLPDANLLFSPRFGFNWDVNGDRSTQIRGGTGLFTGKPAYVWISNQIGNTGVLTGFESLTNTKNRPFTPDITKYYQAATGAPASSYELALTDPNFKFPQIWRSNIAIDQKLPLDFVGTLEYIYNSDVNGIYYINANLTAPDTYFKGFGDNRPRWSKTNRINANVANAIVMKNQNIGYSWNLAASLEKPFSNGLFAKAAYSYGEAKNTVDPGSIAYGSWSGNAIYANPNNAHSTFSASSPGHRVFAMLSYRKEYFNFGATTLSIMYEGRTIGNLSFTYSGDLNGDGATNDLIYIPRNKTEMNFTEYSVTVSGVTRKFTAAEQADAWDKYIAQDDYLSQHRGQYAERNGTFLPMVHRVDLSIVQEVFGSFLGARNSLEFRADVMNFGNLLNKNWGVSQRYINQGTGVIQPLTNPGVDTQGRATYRLRNIGTNLMSKSLEQTSTLSDVYQIQFSIRYLFN